jgi:hypothetical protein
MKGGDGRVKPLPVDTLSGIRIIDKACIHHAPALAYVCAPAYPNRYGASTLTSPVSDRCVKKISLGRSFSVARGMRRVYIPFHRSAGGTCRCKLRDQPTEDGSHDALKRVELLSSGIGLSAVPGSRKRPDL